jgi:MFS family permease
MHGLKQNRFQFGLLVLVNAFVGAMVGLERAILPGFGKELFQIDGNTALLSFIAAFGISKALSNYAVAHLSKRFSRKTILIIGWLFAIPVPFLLMYAPTWNWVIAANILLGINQGLAWSSTVIMKIDIAGEKDRGLAMGINEFAGYLALGIASYLAAELAARYGYATFPFIPGIVFALCGLLITVVWVKDTVAFVDAESIDSATPLLQNVWKETTWQHRNIGTVTLNGLVNNLNDGVIWGLLPLLLLERNFTLSQIGLIAGTYPVIWGISQLFTGRMGDVWCKKQLITIGMFAQAIAIMLIAVTSSMSLLMFSSVLLGFGTALVYPNFLSVVAENSHPTQRAESLSIFRLWRDSGYVIGALLSGVIADSLGIIPALLITAFITALAGFIADRRMCCTNKMFWETTICNPIAPQL